MENSVSKPLLSTKELVLAALMTVLIAVCSWIEIPTAVPFTLQTFAVYLAVLLTGGRNGLLSIVVYLMTGLVGVPVFAGLKSGAGVVFGSTGGYLIGFVFIALLYMVFEKIPAEKKAVRNILRLSSLVAGTAVCYAFGTIWFIKVYTSEQGALEISTALKWCVAPFVMFDLIKLVVAFVLSERIKKYVKI
ncbi:MAG: biotin transporter BioY [Ruminococcus sp.]|nr:biotin transporter BioY [Ruminococcus sp.]